MFPLCPTAVSHRYKNRVALDHIILHYIFQDNKLKWQTVYGRSLKLNDLCKNQQLVPGMIRYLGCSMSKSCLLAYAQ